MIDTKFFIRHVFSRIREIVVFHKNCEIQISGLSHVVGYMKARDKDELERVLKDNEKFFTLCEKTFTIIPSEVNTIAKVNLNGTAFISRCVHDVSEQFWAIVYGSVAQYD